MSTPPFASDGLHVCDCCEKNWDASELADMEHLHARLEAGGTVPSGECPDCGSLCFPYCFDTKDTPLI